jgi:phage tail protein X
MADGISKLRITAYTDGNFTAAVGPAFAVTINPDKYSHGYRIKYTDPQAQGSSGGSPKFNKVPSETVSFELVFDGTGVVPPPVPQTEPPDVAKQVETFKNLVFAYSGKIHSPKFLTLAWGTLLFRCRLSSLDLTYKLFKPDGSPLRATARAVFIGYSDEEELARQANKTSPDLTHLLTVKAGDTLPLMCWEVYGTSAYTVEVARANGLTSFRNIPAGTQLVFPPLREGSA